MRAGLETNIATAIAIGQATSTPNFGFLLPARLPESTGSTTNVSTEAGLTSALGSVANGSIINITANITGGGSGDTLDITRVASSSAPITITCNPGVVISNYNQVNVTGAYLRLRGLDIADATGPNTTAFGVKFDTNAHDNEMDGCTVRGSLNSGILVGLDSTNKHQIWNCVIHNCGSDTNQDHGIYFDQTGGVTGCVVANTLIYDCQAYGIQAYPHASDLIITCCTIDGGVTRGGIVVGSENGDTDDMIIVGVISTNAPWYSIDIYDPTHGDTGNNAYDCIAFGSSLGSYRADSSITYTNCVTSDPLYVNRAAKNFRLQSSSPAISAVQSARYGYVPSRDILGTLRTTADAGCYAH